MTVQEWKAELKKNVDADEYARITRMATNIIQSVHGVQLGTATAALMLAAMAFAESAPYARALIQEPVK